jgi:SAM-dependent methyltransferase
VVERRARGELNYQDDFAWAHHTGFSDFARVAGRGIVRILRRAGINDGLVVDAGCGSGVVARVLTDAGYDVFGFDYSPAMIALAREHAPAARFAVASFVDIELPPCAAVVATGEVLNYLADPANTLDTLRTFFTRVHTALQPGGLLLFDAARRGALPPTAATHITGDGWEVYIESQVDAEARHLTRRVITYRQARRTEEIHHARLYDRPELTALLRHAGFTTRLRRAYATPARPPPHDLYLAQKPA